MLSEPEDISIESTTSLTSSGKGKNEKPNRLSQSTNRSMSKKYERLFLHCNTVNIPLLSLSDGKIVYKLPSQVAVCQDPVIREVIGGGELEKHLSLSYLHPDLSPAPPTSLLTHLGVRYLRGTDVTIVTTAMAKELMTVGGIHSGVCRATLASHRGQYDAA